MQRAWPLGSVVALALLTAPVAADTFGGFSGVDRPYLVNQDRVCDPLSVANAMASGVPKCEKATADVVAKLSIKEPIVQRGSKASFDATASGRSLTVTKTSGDKVVTWTAPDAIGKIVEVYASQYEDRVAVAYTTRRLGKEVTDVVAFEIVKTTGREHPPTTPSTTTTTPTAPTTPTTQAPADPKLEKALAAARKASKARALAAWQGVLALDGDNSEARFRIAAIQVGKKQRAEALESLAALEKSSRADAIEWLVEARFDKAFAPLRADATFRKTVGLDRKAATPYERLMGFGGQWEQTGTSCETPEIRLTTSRDRTLRLRLRSACQGQTQDVSKKGKWRLDGDKVVLVFPTNGKAGAEDEAPCTFEAQRDEDALHCDLGHDLEFTVLPTRR